MAAGRAYPAHDLAVLGRRGSPYALVPWVVTSPATSTLSLIASGTPEERPLVPGLQARRGGLVGLHEGALIVDRTERI